MEARPATTIPAGRRASAPRSISDQHDQIAWLLAPGQGVEQDGQIAEEHVGAAVEDISDALVVGGHRRHAGIELEGLHTLLEPSFAGGSRDGRESLFLEHRPRRRTAPDRPLGWSPLFENLTQSKRRVPPEERPSPARKDRKREGDHLAAAERDGIGAANQVRISRVHRGEPLIHVERNPLHGKLGQPELFLQLVSYPGAKRHRVASRHSSVVLE
jgi:hypothetical protein